ncbi:hypothetical protein Pmani_027121 [Petrolisthes manimaculis]|uniref:Uncharacterized protein n=1 Tax=Petrolisthes manimaculis TaxID=1843537 RepID=A0AAE1P242_9EUCA|nr:hypothetical protein Pmani_027121 [Petrolisthes manimaculis]
MSSVVCGSAQSVVWLSSECYVAELSVVAEFRVLYGSAQSVLWLSAECCVAELSVVAELRVLRSINSSRRGVLEATRPTLWPHILALIVALTLAHNEALALALTCSPGVQ